MVTRALVGQVSAASRSSSTSPVAQASVSRLLASSTRLAPVCVKPLSRTSSAVAGTRSGGNEDGQGQAEGQTPGGTCSPTEREINFADRA